MDLSVLAQLAPVLAAGFTKNPNTVMNAINMTEQGKDAAYKRRLQSFGRELFTSGKIPDAQAVIAAAQAHDIRPTDAMGMINQFMSWKQQRQQMAQAEKAGQLTDQQIAAGQRRADKEQQSDAWRKSYGGEGFDLNRFLTEGRRLGEVPINTMGPMQGSLRPGTVYATDQATGLPQIFQNPLAPQQDHFTYAPMVGVFSTKTGAVKQPPDPRMYDALIAAKTKQGGAGGYLQDQAKLVDDTRAYYSARMQGLKDPLTGMVQRGKESEYQAIVNQMSADMKVIAEGGIPSWLQGGGSSTAGAPAAATPTHRFVPGQGLQRVQ